MSRITPEKVLVRSLLEGSLRAPDSREWTLQGLGMLRTYLDEEKTLRLHVWHSDFAVDGVSQMHTHPWHMESHILAGMVFQHRYEESLLRIDGAEPYMRQSLKCGPGGHLEEAPEEVWLRCGPLEEYSAGQTYKQRADEIHVSLPSDGTVTLIDRTIPDGANPDIAYVFWPSGEEWVSAEPRPAKIEEIVYILGASLGSWF